MNEKIAGITFADLKGKIDFFTSSGVDFHRWCHDLFTFYWSSHFRRVKRSKHTAKPDKARVAAALLSSIDNARQKPTIIGIGWSSFIQSSTQKMLDVVNSTAQDLNQHNLNRRISIAWCHRVCAWFRSGSNQRLRYANRSRSPCLCGCGEMVPIYDNRNRRRYFRRCHSIRKMPKETAHWHWKKGCITNNSSS